MSYLDKYPSGETVMVGDIVMHKRVTDYENRPLVAEVVRPTTFTKEGAPGITFVFLRESMWGFHTYKTLHLPRRNGGYGHSDARNLKFLHRKVEGESVFDPIPREEPEEDEEE